MRKSLVGAVLLVIGLSAGTGCNLTFNPDDVPAPDPTPTSESESHQCEAGDCCDNYTFKQATEVCKTWTEYGCTGTECGATGRKRTVAQYCSGTSAECDGATQAQEWEVLTSCGSNQICETDTTTIAKCATCINGCAGGTCWSECDPSGPCCTAAGRKSDCWYDSGMNLEWENPAQSIADKTLAGATGHCQARGTGWRVPTIGELRSLVRGCSGMITGGSCGVTDACTSSSCQQNCTSCTSQGGGGKNGEYWPQDLDGPQLAASPVVYWSNTRIPDKGNARWVLDYTSAWLWWDYDTGGEHAGTLFATRCVRSRQ